MPFCQYSHLCDNVDPISGLNSEFHSTSVSGAMPSELFGNRTDSITSEWDYKWPSTTADSLIMNISIFSKEDQLSSSHPNSVRSNLSNSHQEKRVHSEHSQFQRCVEQSNAMTLIYTFAAVAYGLTSILIGFSLDTYGLWFTRILGSTMASLGFFSLALTSKDHPWLLWPALNLIALGTSQLRLSCFQFANLWPRHRTVILIAYSSAYSTSTTLFLLVQYAYIGGVQYKTIGYFLGIISLFTFPVTFLMPKIKIEDHKEEESVANEKMSTDIEKLNDRVPEDSTDNIDDIIQMNNIGDDDKVYKSTTIDTVPLKASLRTLSAFLHTIWHFINFFLVLFYSTTFNAWAYKTTDDPDQVAFYNEITGLCTLIAPFFIPLAGFLTDWQIKKASLIEDRVERLAVTMQAPAYTKAAATIFLIATLTCKMFVTKTAIYVSLVLIAISRPFVVGSCTSYIRIRFHSSHFNRLNGIFTTIVSLLAFVQHPIYIWMYSSDESFLHAHWLLMAILVISLSSPGHMLIKNLARKYATVQLKYRTDI